MAEIVGIYAVSHTPVLTNLPGAPSKEVADAAYAAFRSLGERLRSANPDVLLLISDDHLHNFFLDNLPAFCIGAGDDFEGPIEDWLKAPKIRVEGHPQLARALLDGLFENGFDPALSMHLRLDHAMVTPMECMGIYGSFPVVPLYVNCVQPPLPRMARCVEMGRAIRKAIRALPGSLRVAVLGTGGLSHDVGTPRMGIINKAFDEEFLRLLGQDGSDVVSRFAQEEVHTAGNGAEEVRNWLIPHGVSDCRGFELIFYEAVEPWYTGIGLASWKLH
jgi:aromatic ring-opening dioxygenase catalytic subunit (LigB family)